MRESVLAAIFNKRRDKILVIKRRDVPVWVLPGGAIDIGEDSEKAIIREVLEETGLTVSIKRKSALYTPINKLGTTTHLYECAIVSGTPTTGDETADIGFYPLNELPNVFFYIHQHMIEDVVALDRTIEKKLDQVTYLALFRFFLRHPILVIRFAFSQIGLPLNKKP